LDGVIDLSGGKGDLKSRVLGEIRIRDVMMLVGDGSLALSLFVPWIYAFSPPVGPSLQISLVTAPDLLDIVAHSSYGCLVLVPVALAFGIVFFAPPLNRERSLKIAMVAGALVTSFLGNFIFGIQFGAAIGLVMDGSYVSYSVTLGPGTRIAELATAMYFLTLLVLIFTDD